MNRFVATQDALGAPEPHEISLEAFEEARENWNELSNVLLIEERFDSLVTNFLRFEELLVAKLLQFERVGFIDSNHQMFVRRELNRVLNNLLSSARGYIDQLPQVANRVFGPSDQRAHRCTEILREQYDGALGYRALEALRNHAQHSGFPIHAVSYSTRMIGRFPKLIDTKCLIPIAQVDVLAENGKFKRSVLKEIESLGREVDLQPLVRQYVAGISRAHYFLRSETREHSVGCGAALAELANPYILKLPKQRPALGIYAVALSGGKWKEKIPLRTEVAEYYDYLCGLNSNLEFVDREFLIGHVREDA